MGTKKTVFKLLTILRSHKGKGKPVTALKLSGKLRIPEREVRQMISDLVTNKKILIASRVRKPYGFYLITSLDELKECLAQYHSRLKNLKARTESLYKAGLIKFAKDIQDEFKFD